MNRKELLGVRNIFPDDIIHDLRCARAQKTLFDKEIREYKKELEENDNVDESFKMLMLYLVDMEESFEPQKEVQDKDDVNECDDDSDSDSEEENDPGYELFFKHLKEHNKSYALDYEKDGVHVVLNYEEDSDSEDEHNLEPIRKRQRATKQKLGLSNQRHGVENQRKRDKKSDSLKRTKSLTRRKVTDEVGTVANVKAKRSRKQKVGPSNQMPDVENQPFSALEMTARLTRSRTKLANEVEAENTKGSPDAVLVSQKECDPEPRRKQNRVGKQKRGRSTQMPDVENQPSNALEVTKPLTWSWTKLANEVEVQNMKGSPDVVSVSHKECDSEPKTKRNRVGKQKMRPSNQMRGAENRPSNALEMTTCLIQSRTKLANEVEVENTKFSPNVVLVSHKESDPEPTRKQNRVGKQKMWPSNQMPGAENRPSNALEMTTCLTRSRTKLANEVEVENTKFSPNVVLVSHKESDPEPTRKQNRVRKQTMEPSNQMPGAEKQPSNALEMTTHLTQSQTKLVNEVEVENTKGSPNVVLVSDKKFDPEPRRKQNRVWKRKMGPSNKTPGPQNQHEHDQQTTSVKKTNDLTKRKSPNEANKVENTKALPNDVVLDLQCHHLHLNAELQDKDYDPEPCRKLDRARIQNVGPSNKIPHVKNRPSSSPDMVFVSHTRKLNKVPEQKMGPSNQTSGIENQHDKKTNGLTPRKSLNNADKVEVAPDHHYHHFHEDIKPEDDCYGYMHKDKEIEPEPRRQVNVDWKQNVGPSNQMPDVNKKREATFEVDKFLTKRQVTFEVDKVNNDNDRLNSMALDSHKERNSKPGRTLNQAMKQKVGPSNQVADVVNKKWKHDQLSCSLNKTRGLTKRKVTFEVDKVCSMKGTPNDMVFNSNKECNLQPTRKVNGATKQHVRPSNQMPAAENKLKGDQQCSSLEKSKCQTQRKSTDGVKVENIKDSPKDMVPVLQYLNLHQNVKINDDHYGYMHEVNAVVNEKNHGPNDVGQEAKEGIGSDQKIYGVGEVKNELKNDSDSDMEILDSEAIIEAGILSTFVPSKKFHESVEDEHPNCGEFRKKVLNALQKPFDKDEYMRHQEAAKCYLDHHPDLRRKLKKYRYKQRKRLTIYRGFFFWLQNLTQEGSFKPWKDLECLAVEPWYP